MKRNARWVRWSSIAAAFSVLAVTPVLAQDTGLGSYASPMSFGVFAGASIPLGDFKDAANTGWHAGGLLQWNSPTAPVGFRVDGAFNRFGDKGLGSYRIIDGTLNGVWMIPTTGPTARPYLLGGGGVYNESCTGCESQTKFGVNGGGGINVPLSGFATIIEGRFHLVFDSTDEPPISNTRFIQVSVGLLFR